MKQLLYIIAAILLFGWAIGTFALHADGVIYVLLVLSIVAFLLGVVNTEEF